MATDEAGHLGSNIRRCRELRGLSQVQMAKLAGLPRATWTHLESGEANPTLQVLIKAANALQVRVEELISRGRDEVEVVRADALRGRTRGPVTIRSLLPETLAGLDLERMTFPAGARLTGVPHRDGTREYLTCERGAIELVVGGNTYRLAPGDVVAFNGAQKHAYVNVFNGETVSYSVIAFAPVTT